MKKLTALFSSLFLYAFTVAPAFAQNGIRLCPQGTDFSNLCNLQNLTAAGVITFILTTMLIIVAIISLIFLVLGGLRWVLSGGDKGKVEAARNTIVAAVIGLAVAFAAFFIFNIVTTLLLGHSLSGVNLPTLTQ